MVNRCLVSVLALCFVLRPEIVAGQSCADLSPADRGSQTLEYALYNHLLNETCLQQLSQLDPDLFGSDGPCAVDAANIFFGSLLGEGRLDGWALGIVQIVILSFLPYFLTSLVFLPSVRLSFFHYFLPSFLPFR